MIYFDGNKKSYYIKRFLVDNTMSRFSCITNHKDSQLEVVSTEWRPQVELLYVKEKGRKRKREVISIEDFISIKGSKALGNKLTSKKVKEINLIASLPYEDDKINKMDEEVVEDVVLADVSNQGEIELEITNEITEDERVDSDKDSDDEYNGEQIILEL